MPKHWSLVMKADGVLKAKYPSLAVAGLFLLSATPALAAPPEVEAYCRQRSFEVRLEVRRGAWEQFMANCIADLTPTPTKRKDRK
jgi:hypothetical protein